jgi:transmembrane sensor
VTNNSKPTWDELRDEAASWLARMDSGSATVKQFETWREADPRHAAAFVQVAHGLTTLDRLKPELKAILPKVKPSRRRELFLGGAAAIFAAAGFGVYTAARARTTVRTLVGELKSLDVPGGHLTINTDSVIRLKEEKSGTDIWLDRGEIAIDAKGGDRSCRLFAAGRVAEISQGALNARLRGKMLDVAVSSGRCLLKADDVGGTRAKATDTTVSANQAVLVSGEQNVVRPLTPPDAEFLAGWQNGEMVFQGQTLETAVGEYNRYLTRKIYIADPSLGAIRLGGRFTTQNPRLFLQSLRDGFGVKVNDSGNGSVVLTK